MKKSDDKALSVRRSEYLKGLRITSKINHRTKDLQNLISIETFDIQKQTIVELVMRNIHDVESLSLYIVNQYGGHIIPVFKPDASDKDIDLLNAKIQKYLNALQRNKYCRQDPRFYCFLIQQNSVFPKQLAYEKALRNAADLSRKYLNSFFTRKNLPHENMKELIASYTSLTQKIQQYREVKQIALIKIKEFVSFEETMNLFAELTTVPCMAVEPHEQQIQEIWKLIKSSDSLIEQGEAAHSRWEILIEQVREIQSNVYKGLHEDIQYLEMKEHQLKSWNESLDVEFYDLSEYLVDKMNMIAKFVFKVKRKMIDFAVMTSTNDETYRETEAVWKKAAIHITKAEQEARYDSPVKLKTRLSQEDSKLKQKTEQTQQNVEGEPEITNGKSNQGNFDLKSRDEQKTLKIQEERVFGENKSEEQTGEKLEQEEGVRGSVEEVTCQE